MAFKEWQKKAHRLYFEEHRKITEISELVGKTRQTVSCFLQAQPEWEKEQTFRKEESAKRRKKQKLFYDMLHRSEPNLFREHEIAVRILSAEKYH